MSIASEITRLQSAKADIKTSIEGKGVTVPSSATLDEYSGYIDDIPTGSTPVINPLSVTENGTYSAPSGVDGYSPVVVSVSGGGGGSVEESDVNFYDYDGTCVASYTAADFANLTAMPSNPSHTGLTAQGWNWSLAGAKTYVAKYGRCDIGQMYITDDGKTRLYCHFRKGRISPYLSFAIDGTVEIDWGDGNTTTATGTSMTTKQNYSHTYAKEGKYVITLNAISGTFRFDGTTTDGLFKQTTSTQSSTYRSAAYQNALIKVELGNNIEIGNAFCLNTSLESVTLPKGLTISNTSASNSANVFQACNTIRAIIIPSEIIFKNSASSMALYGCQSLHKIVLPESGATKFSAQNANSLPDIYLPDDMTSLKASVLNGAYSLTNLTIPETVTAVGVSAFNNCYAMGEYHFKPTAPPTLGGTNAFTNIPSDCKIYVPAASLETYKTATNWSTYASMMVGE